MTKKTTNLSKDQTVREARVALAKKVIDNLEEKVDVTPEAAPGRWDRVKARAKAIASGIGREVGQQASAYRQAGSAIGRVVNRNIPQTTVRGRSGPEGTTTPGRLSKFKSKLPSWGDIKSKGRDLYNNRNDPIKGSPTKFPTSQEAADKKASDTIRKLSNRLKVQPAAAEAPKPAAATPAETPAAATPAAATKKTPSAQADQGSNVRRVKRVRNQRLAQARLWREKPQQSWRSSTEIIRNSRMALAEMVLSELTRSEKLRLSQGGVTMAGIKAARIKQRRADPKAQRYMARGVPQERGQEPARGVPQERGQEPLANAPGIPYAPSPDNPAAGHNRHFAGQIAADRRQKKKYADARAAGKVTRVERASTEIVKNGRMALAEKVLEALAPASKKYLATRRAGHASPIAYGNIPVNPDRQEARDRHRQGQGDGPTRPAPELDGGQLVKNMIGKSPEASKEIAQNAKNKHKKDTSRWLRREGRIDRQSNYSNRPSGPQSQQASTEIVKNGRMALAEKVLERLAEDEEEFTKAQLAQQTEKVKKASQAKKRGETTEEPQATVGATKHTSQGPLGHSRANSLVHSLAAHRTRSGEPVKSPKATQDSTSSQRRNQSKGNAFGTSKRAVANAEKKVRKKETELGREENKTGRYSIEDINKSGVGGHTTVDKSGSSPVQRMTLKAWRMKNAPPKK